MVAEEILFWQRDHDIVLNRCLNAVTFLIAVKYIVLLFSCFFASSFADIPFTVYTTADV